MPVIRDSSNNKRPGPACPGGSHDHRKGATASAAPGSKPLATSGLGCIAPEVSTVRSLTPERMPLATDHHHRPGLSPPGPRLVNASITAGEIRIDLTDCSGSAAQHRRKNCRKPLASFEHFFQLDYKQPGDDRISSCSTKIKHDRQFTAPTADQPGLHGGKSVCKALFLATLAQPWNQPRPAPGNPGRACPSG